MKLIKLLITLLIICISTACTKHNRKADISNIDLDIKIERFDIDFWKIDTNNIKTDAAEFMAKYPEMGRIYLQNVLMFGHPDSTSTWDTYKIFKRDKSVDTLYNDALNKYADVRDFEKELTLAFRRAKYFFPELITPKVRMHVSGFNQSVIVGREFISLSIDNYMGEDYEIYKKVGNIHDYQRANMRPEKVVSDYLTAWFDSEFTHYQKQDGRTLLDEMIYRGKMMYLLSILLPDEEDSILIGYNTEAWTWAEEYETEMWQTLIANNDIFSQDFIKNGGYLNDGPFTIYFSQDSPARAGVYLGWKIINSYMQHNTDISPLQLMHNSDAQQILQQSGYNPK